MLSAIIISALISVIPIGDPAQGPFEKADRLNNPEQLRETVPPPPPSMPAFSSANDGRTCFGAIPLLEWFNPGWDVNHMARIMWRESNCVPTASNSCCSGLLQMHQMHVPRHGACGVTSRQDYYDPAKNICAAAMLFTAAGGMSPWAQTR